MSAARKYIQPYLHKVYDWTQHNNLIINPDKTTCTLFTPDPAECNSNLGLNINNKVLPMALHPKVLGLTLDPKLTYNAHIQNIATHALKPLQVIKALTGTTWGKQKEMLVATHKAVMRPSLEYASSIWLLLLSTHSSLIIGGSPLLLSDGGSPPASPASLLAGLLRRRDPSTNPGPIAWWVSVGN